MRSGTPPAATTHTWRRPQTAARRGWLVHLQWPAMRLTVLGCAGGIPTPSNPNTALLLRAADTAVLIDFGLGAMGALQRHLDPEDLDAVVVTHLHADHTADLPALLVQRRYNPVGREERRPLRTPPTGRSSGSAPPTRRPPRRARARTRATSSTTARCAPASPSGSARSPFTPMRSSTRLRPSASGSRTAPRPSPSAATPVPAPASTRWPRAPTC
jgi:hypothetical protein